MRYVIVPEPLALFAGQLRYPLAKCVEYVVDNDQAFQKPASKIREAQRILTAFEVEGNVVELKDDDWASLNKAFEEPAAGYGSFGIAGKDAAGNAFREELKVPARTFLPFVDAISEAKNSPPEK